MDENENTSAAETAEYTEEAPVGFEDMPPDETADTPPDWWDDNLEDLADWDGDDSGQGQTGADRRDAEPADTADTSKPGADSQTWTEPDVPDQREAEPAEPDWKAIAQGYQEREAAARFRQVYQEQKDAGMTDEAARIIAREACGGNEYPLEDNPAGDSAVPSPDALFPPGSQDALRASLQRLSTLFPDVREMPRDVTRAIMEGQDAVAAYASFRTRQDAETIKALREKVAALEQNAANRDRAVVRGVAGETGQKPKDPWLEGFDSYKW